MYEDVAIVGYGETDYHKDPADQLEPMEYLADAINRALSDSGIQISDVDGFTAASFETRMENVTTLAHHFGIDGRWFLEGTFGGASAISGLLRGALAIEQDNAETVVVVAGDSTTPASNMSLVDGFNISLRNGMTPFGFGGTNGLFAMIQRRHMHEYGTTRKQLSHIATTLRSHARMNPNANLQGPMTTDDYLNARPIVEPIHLYDCVLPCGGGGAYVLTSRDKAQDLETDNVYILAGDEHHNPDPHQPFALSTSLKHCRGIFDGGITHQDVDCVQLYDDYPIMAVIQLEDLGFCKKGEGGQLSMGQAGAAGGILAPIEAIRQLRGEGGDRQVPDCSIALATGFGMVAYGGGLSASGVLLSDSPPEEVTA
jgi:acetyl-CoA acetyltransferase